MKPSVLTFGAAGRSIFLLDPGRIPRLTALLAEWNVEIQENLVVDPNPIARLFGADELMPLINNYDSHVIVRDLQNVATLFLKPARFRSRATECRGRCSIAVQEFRAELGGGQPLNPDRFSNSGRVEMHEVLLRWGVAGTLGAEDGESTDGPDVTPEAEAEGKTEGRFVVVGTSRFAINSVIGFNGNREPVLNMINWLSEDEDLISIRPKEPDSQRLDLNQAQMGRIRYLTLIVMPLLILAFGFSVWWGRR